MPGRPAVLSWAVNAIVYGVALLAVTVLSVGCHSYAGFLVVQNKLKPTPYREAQGKPRPVSRRYLLYVNYFLYISRLRGAYYS